MLFLEHKKKIKQEENPEILSILIKIANIYKSKNDK